MKAQTVLWRHFISLISASGEGRGNSPAFFPGFGYNLFSGLWAIKQGMLLPLCLRSRLGFTQSKGIWLHFG